MALTRTAFRAAFRAKKDDPNLPAETDDFLDKYFERDDEVGYSYEQMAPRVEQFLQAPATAWTLERVQRIIAWYRDNRDSIPE